MVCCNSWLMSVMIRRFHTGNLAPHLICLWFHREHWAIWISTLLLGLCLSGSRLRCLPGLFHFCNWSHCWVYSTATWCASSAVLFPKHCRMHQRLSPKYLTKLFRHQKKICLSIFCTWYELKLHNMVSQYDTYFFLCCSCCCCWPTPYWKDMWP